MDTTREDGPSLRDVLAGAVALEEGFIDFAQFRAGLQACDGGSAPSMPAALESSGALDPRTRQAIERTVQARITAAGGNARQALSASMQGLPGEVAIFAESTVADSDVPRLDQVVSAPRTYTLDGFLGSGGAGRVYHGRDAELGRPVAIKFLRPDRASPRAQARFQNEARIGALLEHPNICPVYAAGREQDGSLFLVLKWVRGRSLEDVIQTLQEGDPEPLAEFPLARRVEVLIQACQGIEYAHSRGILHRDLKPGNIMLGRHGEVFVMDWGLAKLAGIPDLSASARASHRAKKDWTAQPSPDAFEADLTADGHLIGTPAYMAPEQIRGENERVDARTEVYALGTTLYELLTLRKPFPRESFPDLVAAINQVEPSPLRAIDPTIPADLEAICLRCLQKEPNDRYLSVEGLLTDLRAFRDGRVVVAAGTGPWIRIRKWAARNRTVATVAAVALLLVTAVGLGSGFLVLKERADAALRESAVREQTLEAMVAKARQASDDAWARLQDAGGTSQANRVGLALAALQAAQRWQVLVPADRPAARRRFDAALALGEVALKSEQWELAAQAYSSVKDLGVDDALATRRLTRVGEAREAEAKRKRAAVVAVLADVASSRRTRRPQGKSDAVFRIVRYPEPQTVELLVARLDAVSRALLAAERELVLRRAGGVENLARALATRARTAPGRPLPLPDQRTLDEALARIAERSEFPQARGPRPTALAEIGSHQRAVVGQRTLDVAEVACRALGRIGIRARAAAALGRYLRAEANELRAVPAGLALIRLGGGDALKVIHWARRRYGLNGNFATQTAWLLRATRNKSDLALEGEDARSYVKRGEARRSQGDLKGAVADFTKAIQLDPNDAVAWGQRGIVRCQLGNTRGALTDLNRALKLNPDFSPALINRGILRHDLRDHAGAVADLTRAIRIDPQIAHGWASRGSAYQSMGKLDLAIADYTRAIKLNPDFAVAICNRGGARSLKGDLEGAILDYSRAIRIDPNYASAYYNRGSARAKLRRFKLAIGDYTQALERKPRFPQAWNYRGVAREMSGDTAGALADYTQAIKIAPRLVSAYAHRARLHSSLGKQEQAIADCTRALKLDPNETTALGVRGTALVSLGRGQEALPDLERFVRLAPHARAVPRIKRLIKKLRAEGKTPQQ